MNEQIGFLEIRRMGNAIFPHLNGRITTGGIRQIQRAYADLKASGESYCIVVPIPKRHAKLTRICKLIGLKYWYQTVDSLVYGDYFQ